MSFTKFYIRQNGVKRTAVSVEEFSVVDGKFLVSVCVPGYYREDYQLYVGFEDIWWMNTEAAGWLEHNGVKVPSTAPVHGVGYGAAEKQAHWDSKRGTDG